MPNVIQIKVAAARRAARLLQEDDVDSEAEEPDGLLQFTHGRGGTRMVVKGVYADRLQSGIYTLIKGLNDLADKLVASGGAGHYSIGPVDEFYRAAPPQRRAPGRRLPRRLAESSEFGAL